MASARSVTRWRGGESTIAMTSSGSLGSAAFGFANRLLGALEANLRVRAVAERFVGRAATPAERDPVTGHREGLAVSVDEVNGPLHQVRTVRPGLDGHLVHSDPP